MLICKKICLIFILLMIIPQIAIAINISFFEEFPDETTFGTVSMIDFDTRIYIAARNLSEFYNLENKLKYKNEHIEEVIYWPVLSKEEGYWISPWSDSEALSRVFENVLNRSSNHQLVLLLDLEPPLKRSRLLNFEDFKHNKEVITNFVKSAKSYNISVITVEKSYIPDSVLEVFALSFNPKIYGNKRAKMYYSSFRRRFLPEFIVDYLFERKVMQYSKDGTIIGIGLIASGVHNESYLNSPVVLQKELAIASEHSLSETIVFSLDGLYGSYAAVIKEFS